MTNQANIFISNTVDQLIERMNLKRADPFQPVYIVTQTSGIVHYLKLKLAEKYGVSAHLKFISPNDLILGVGKILNSKVSSEFSTDNLRWRIFHIIDNEEFKSRFSFISDYFNGSELKRFQLATKLADLFDQYSVFRTSELKNWEQLKYQPKNSTEEWQRWLWLEIKKSIGDQGRSKIEMAEIFKEQILDEKFKEAIHSNFPEVHIFGLTILTRYHMELLWQIAKVTSVNFYFVNPCISDYWYDGRSAKEKAKAWAKNRFKKDISTYQEGNELLLSWGKLVRELYQQLFDLEDDVFSCIEIIETPENETKSLLKQLQNDVKNNVFDDDRSIDADQLLDGSIRIVSNYSIYRELEVLYDSLIKAFDEDQYLSPHNIVVMVPEIDEYLPFIRAVFDNASLKIPYTVGDLSLSSSENFFQVAMDLMKSYKDHLTSESILSLLDYQIIRDRYNIHDVEFIRRICLDLNIRRGVKGDKKLETHLIGWEQGLKRILGSLMMFEGRITFLDDELPVSNEVEGQERAGEILRFGQFALGVIQKQRQVESKKEISEWNTFLLGLISHLSNNQEDKYELDDLLKELGENLNQLDRINRNFEGIKIEFDTYFHLIKGFYDNSSQENGYFRGRLTFCKALPLRSIPFKFVAFLGLNEKSFPRKSTRSSIDLISSGFEKKIGDRNVKDNDKFLFMEAFMNAEDTLFLSYLGKNDKNNKMQNPSILVSELLAYISKKYQYPGNSNNAIFSSGKNALDEVSKNLVVQHPLHQFSKVYGNDEKLFTYKKYNQSDTYKIALSQENDLEEIEKINWKDLKSFFKDSFDFYLKKGFGIYQDSEVLEVPESEHFGDFDNLELFTIKRDFIENQIVDFEEYILENKKIGLFPLGNVGKVKVSKILQEISPLKEKLENRNLETVSGELKLSNISISFDLDGFENDKLVRYTISKSIQKHLISSYLDALILSKYFNKLIDIEFLSLNEKTKEIEVKSLSLNRDLKYCNEELIHFVSFYKEARNKPKFITSSFDGKIGKIKLISKEYSSIGIFETKMDSKSYKVEDETIKNIESIFENFLEWVN